MSKEITGILIDRSFSNIGHDFTQGFSQIWGNQPTKPRYSVTLREESSGMRGSKISIAHKHRMLYIGNLNRRADNSENGRLAAKAVIQKLRAMASGSPHNPDLAEDEF